MSVMQFLSKVERLGIRIELAQSDRQLKIKAPEGVLNSALISELKTRKEEIITFLEDIKKQDRYASIKPVEKKDYYAVSSTQKRLYVLQQMDKDAVAYNMPSVWQLELSLDKEPLEHTFKMLIHRHESLRTSFQMLDEEPVQKIHEEVEFEIHYEEVSGEEPLISDKSSQGESGLSIKKTIENFIKPFDLSVVPLLRIGLLKIHKQKYILIIDMHHIISDGVSHGILVKDFAPMYSGNPPFPLRLHYKDYSEWQRRERSKEEAGNQEKLWLQHFKGEIPLLNLPLDYPRPPIQSFEGGTVDFEFNIQETIDINGLAQNQEITLFMVLLAIFYVFLAKLSGQEDIVVGTPIAGRSHPELEQIIGMFVNTLALRNYPRGEKTFAEFLNQVKTLTLEAFENQDYPFDELVEKVSIERDISRNPLFDVMFGLLNQAEVTQRASTTKEGHPSVKPYQYERKASKFDLTLNASEQKEKLIFSLKYCTKLFRQETILGFVQYFKTIAAQVARDRQIKISAIEIISGIEKEQLLVDFNRTVKEYPLEKSLQQLFQEQVESSPARIALAFANQQLSYRELNVRANQLAGLLRRKGTAKDSIIALILSPGLEIPLAIWAVLKAGGGFLPIDPEYPGERIDYLLKDSNCMFVLYHHLLPASLQFKGEIIDLQNPRTYTNDGNSSLWAGDPGGIAYTIFTSGTTGKPKGVLVNNKNLCNYVHWFSRKSSLTEKDRTVLISSFSFDLGYTALFPSLLNGAELHLLGKEMYAIPQQLLKYLEKNSISYIKITPSLLSVMVNSPGFSPGALRRLRLVVVGGEPINLKDIKKLREICNNMQIMNHYGPTEATIGSIARYIDFQQFAAYENNPTIGTPVDNAKVYILDKYLLVLPAGIPGELCIAGACIARGYLNRPELTAEKFDQDLWDYRDYPDKKFLRGSPGGAVFSKSAPPGRRGQKIYKTGDLAKWMPDGMVEFLGRVDNQVKIRGYRIELGEIENRLLGYGDIQEAAVIVKQDAGGNPYLCAYIATTSKFSLPDLRAYMARSLPDYMIPSYYISLEKFPLTANGKINRKELPEPEALHLEQKTEYEAPRNEIEKKLLETWREVLRKEALGIKDNFFINGGDSIKAIQIAARMRKEGYKLEMRTIFLNPTIAELSACVKKLKRIPDQVVVTGLIPLTPIQAEFFLHSQNHCHHYNLSVMLYSKEGFQEEGIRVVFSKILEHHDALRITFSNQDHQVIQSGRGLDLPLSMQVYNMTKQENALKQLQGKSTEIQSSLNLEKGPLMKLGLFHLDQGDFLLIAVHHLVVDGISWRILFEDIETLYQQYKKGKKPELPKKSDSFKLWAEKLLEYADSEALLKEKSYWKILEIQEIAPIKKDFPGGDNAFKDMESCSFYLSEAETKDLLEKVNDFLNTGINDILLTALGLAFRQTFGHDRISILLESHGREDIIDDIDISRTVGWFSSKFPVLLNVSMADDFTRQIKEVKETLRHIPCNGIGYWILKHLTAKEHKQDICFRHEPQVTFNYLGQFDADVSQRSFQLVNEYRGISISPERQRNCEIEVSGMIVQQRLVMSISFSREQYKKQTIEMLGNNYHSCLTRVISHCLAQKERELTPSDLTYNELSIGGIENLQGMLENIKNFKKDPIIKTKGNIRDIYPLSPMQEGILFHSLVNREFTVYFEQVSYRLSGNLDIDIVKESLNQLLKRYDILRTLFIYEGQDRPLQVVLEQREIDSHYEDLRETQDKEDFIRIYRENDRKRYFDLHKDVLLRVTVLRLAEKEFEFIWSHHHILMDGWCRAILISEFFEIYNSFLQGRSYRLKEPVQYRTFIKWLEKQNSQEAKSFWKKYLEGYEYAVGIPKANSPGSQAHKNEYRQRQLSIELEKEETTVLNRLGAKVNVTLNVIMRVIWGILLGKYNGKEDVVFGAVVSGRPLEIEGVESMIGLFINTVPVRIRLSGKIPFKELLQIINKSTLESEPYHYYSLAEIQGESFLKQNLLDHILVFENYPMTPNIEGYENKESANNPGVTLRVSGMESFERTNYNFNLLIIPGERLSVRFDYNENIYCPNFVEGMANHLRQMLYQITENEELTIDSLSLLSKEERQRLLVDFNATAREFPRHNTLHGLFAAQAEQTPDHIALVNARSRGGNSVNNGYLTYRNLERKSVQLAGLLKQKGVGGDVIVALMMERSLEMMVGIYAILQAGGAYLPIDPGYPGQRIDFILRDSSTRVLLTASRQAEEVMKLGSLEAARNFEIICIDMPEQSILSNSSLPCLSAGPSSNLAYVIYTSGSTGQPKGVLLEHRPVVNRLHWMQRYSPIGTVDVLLQKTPITFDVSVWELFWWSMHGASLCLLGPGDEKNPQAIINAISTHNVTVIHFVPSMLTAFLEYVQNDGKGAKLTGLRQVFASGEALALPQVNSFVDLLYKPVQAKLSNLYGPTEAAIDVSYFDCTGAGNLDKIPIGKPIDNILLLVLDKDRQLQPIDIPGELCITGIGLARGYLNKPQLTAEKFFTLSNNFSTILTSKKLYRTGDWARWLPDGNLEFLGRMDHQVKIRGFRIELGEIENRLLKHQDIKEAVVLAGDYGPNPAAAAGAGGGEKSLSAYIVTQCELNAAQLREYLLNKLPGYMIPSWFVQVEKIPLTPNGKIDRRALTEMGKRLVSGYTYIPPENEIERKIADIWKDMLQVEKIGITDNYFDLGGNSLQIIRINSKLKKLFQVEIPLVSMFRYTTIKALAQYIMEGEKEIRDWSREVKRSKEDRRQRLQKRRGTNNNG